MGPGAAARYGHWVTESEWAALPENLDERRLAEVLTGMGIETKPSTLQKWRQRGGGPPWWRMFGRAYYTRDKLRAWLEAQQKVATTRPRRARGEET